MSERFVGIDLGLRPRHRASVFDGAKACGRSFGVEVSRQGFDELIARATDGAAGPVHFVFEPTGLAWVPLSAYLAHAGHRLYRVPPQKAADLRKFLRKHTKSDSIDAASLARLPQIDPTGVSQMRVPTAEQTTLVRLVRQRDRMVRDVGKGKRRLHALLAMVNPSLVQALGARTFGVAALAFLKRYADPEKVLRLGRRRLRMFWGKHSHNNAPKDRADKVYEACQQTAELYRPLRQANTLPFDLVAVQQELAVEIGFIEHYQRQADALEKQIVALHEQIDPHQTLQRLYGVGSIIAAGIDATVGDITRFRNSRCFVSFTGLCPRKHQSGTSDPSMPITKSGHRLLKMYLYLAAERARHLDPDFAAYYAKRYAAGHHHNRILVALARKMALRVYALLKRRHQACQSDTFQKPTYTLRDADGKQIEAPEAKALIQRRYARAVVAPARHQRDTIHKTTTEVTTVGHKWPPKDATHSAAVPPSSTPLARSNPNENQPLTKSQQDEFHA